MVTKNSVFGYRISTAIIFINQRARWQSRIYANRSDDNIDIQIKMLPACRAMQRIWTELTNFIFPLNVFSISKQ